MYEIFTYHVDVESEVDEIAFNAASPIKAQVIQVEAATARLTTHTDQSGLIGLMRYLHQQGLVLLSVTRERQKTVREKRNEDSYNNKRETLF